MDEGGHKPDESNVVSGSSLLKSHPATLSHSLSCTTVIHHQQTRTVVQSQQSNISTGQHASLNLLQVPSGNNNPRMNQFMRRSRADSDSSSVGGGSSKTAAILPDSSLDHSGSRISSNLSSTSTPNLATNSLQEPSNHHNHPDQKPNSTHHNPLPLIYVKSDLSSNNCSSEAKELSSSREATGLESARGMGSFIALKVRDKKEASAVSNSLQSDPLKSVSLEVVKKPQRNYSASSVALDLGAISEFTWISQLNWAQVKLKQYRQQQEMQGKTSSLIATVVIGFATSLAIALMILAMPMLRPGGPRRPWTPIENWSFLFGIGPLVVTAICHIFGQSLPQLIIGKGVQFKGYFLALSTFLMVEALFYVHHYFNLPGWILGLASFSMILICSVGLPVLTQDYQIAWKNLLFRRLYRVFILAFVAPFFVHLVISVATFVGVVRLQGRPLLQALVLLSHAFIGLFLRGGCKSARIDTTKYHQSQIVFQAFYIDLLARNALLPWCYGYLDKRVLVLCMVGQAVSLILCEYRDSVNKQDTAPVVVQCKNLFASLRRLTSVPPNVPTALNDHSLLQPPTTSSGAVEQVESNIPLQRFLVPLLANFFHFIIITIIFYAGDLSKLFPNLYHLPVAYRYNWNEAYCASGIYTIVLLLIMIVILLRIKPASIQAPKVGSETRQLIFYSLVLLPLICMACLLKQFHILWYYCDNSLYH